MSQIPTAQLEPCKKQKSKRTTKIFRKARAALRAFPIITRSNTIYTRLPFPHRVNTTADGARIPGAKRLTGTLFGHKKANITLAIQDKPGSVPILLLELAVPTNKFMTDMGSSGLIRLALECDKKTEEKGAKKKLLEEPMWAAYINGKGIGYGTRRDPTEVDLQMLQLLQKTSMGAGVLPEAMNDPVDGELTYMRAYFDRVIGSKDSETFYMLNPDSNSGPELSVFFVRS